MTEISKYLEVYTKDYILELALAEVVDNVDKRQGAVIFDSLAIVSGKLADVFMEIKKIVEQSYMRTATVDENIEYRAQERGVRREQATQAERLGVFTNLNGTAATIPTGALFCTIDENKENVVNFKVIGPHTVDDIAVLGSYVLQCETPGTIGNTYFGELLPLTDMDTLGSATLTTVLTPARDRETNESVKQRYYDTFNLEAFGGNIADYRQYMQSFTGVGQTQIYPRTQEDHNIVISCVDPSNQPISVEYQNTVKEELDPENYYNNGNNTEGMGLGVVPIGHKVKVMAPQSFEVNVELQVILSSTAYYETVKQNIEEKIQNYIKQVQNTWSKGDGVYEIIIYYNQVVSAASTAEGVINVNGCLVNGGTQNILLTQNRDNQSIPYLANVTVSEV